MECGVWSAECGVKKRNNRNSFNRGEHRGRIGRETANGEAGRKAATSPRHCRGMERREPGTGEPAKKAGGQDLTAVVAQLGGFFQGSRLRRGRLIFAPDAGEGGLDLLLEAGDQVAVGSDQRLLGFDLGDDGLLCGEGWEGEFYRSDHAEG